MRQSACSARCMAPTHPGGGRGCWLRFCRYSCTRPCEVFCSADHAICVLGLIEQTYQTWRSELGTAAPAEQQWQQAAWSTGAGACGARAPWVRRIHQTLIIRPVLRCVSHQLRSSGAVRHYADGPRLYLLVHNRLIVPASAHMYMYTLLTAFWHNNSRVNKIPAQRNSPTTSKQVTLGGSSSSSSSSSSSKGSGWSLGQLATWTQTCSTSHTTRCTAHACSTGSLQYLISGTSSFHQLSC
jgi:hypothetical protein